MLSSRRAALLWLTRLENVGPSLARLLISQVSGALTSFSANLTASLGMLRKAVSIAFICRVYLAAFTYQSLPLSKF